MTKIRPDHQVGHAGSDSIRFGSHQRRCLYCGVSLTNTQSKDKYPSGQLEALMEEARRTITDGDQLKRRLDELRRQRTAPLNADHYEFRRLLGDALEMTHTPEALQKALDEIKASLHMPPELMAVDHIRPRKWGGQTRHDNLFLNVCRKCNGDDRGFIPFPYWVNGLDGNIEQDLATQEDIFVPTGKTRLSETGLRILQSNLAAGLGHLMMSDARVPVTGKDNGRYTEGWTRRSFFVAALPNMLHLPNVPLTKKNLGQRIAMVFEPLVKRNPGVFLTNDAEEYLITNQRGYQDIVQTFIRQVLIPLRREFRRKRALIVDPAGTGKKSDESK